MKHFFYKIIYKHCSTNTFLYHELLLQIIIIVNIMVVIEYNSLPISTGNSDNINSNESALINF
jgi:hypothetical protein